MGKRVTYLYDLLSGRKKWTDKFKDLFAEAIGFSVTEILHISEVYNRTKCFFPYYKHVENVPEYTVSRASKITALAAENLRLKPIGVFENQNILSVWSPEPFVRYINREIHDSCYYVQILNTLKTS